MIFPIYAHATAKVRDKGGGWHFFKKGGDTCQVGDDLKRGGDPTPLDTMNLYILVWLRFMRLYLTHFRARMGQKMGFWLISRVWFIRFL